MAPLGARPPPWILVSSTRMTSGVGGVECVSTGQWVVDDRPHPRTAWPPPDLHRRPRDRRRCRLQLHRGRSGAPRRRPHPCRRRRQGPAAASHGAGVGRPLSRGAHPARLHRRPHPLPADPGHRLLRRPAAGLAGALRLRRGRALRRAGPRRRRRRLLSRRAGAQRHHHGGGLRHGAPPGRRGLLQGIAPPQHPHDRRQGADGPGRAGRALRHRRERLRRLQDPHPALAWQGAAALCGDAALRPRRSSRPPARC